jgi:hypothetical protein
MVESARAGWSRGYLASGPIGLFSLGADEGIEALAA